MKWLRLFIVLWVGALGGVHTQDWDLRLQKALRKSAQIHPVALDSFWTSVWADSKMRKDSTEWRSFAQYPNPALQIAHEKDWTEWYLDKALPALVQTAWEQSSNPWRAWAWSQVLQTQVPNGGLSRKLDPKDPHPCAWILHYDKNHFALSNPCPQVPTFLLLQPPTGAQLHGKNNEKLSWESQCAAQKNKGQGQGIQELPTPLGESCLWNLRTAQHQVWFRTTPAQTPAPTLDWEGTLDLGQSGDSVLWLAHDAQGQPYAGLGQCDLHGRLSLGLPSTPSLTKVQWVQWQKQNFKTGTLRTSSAPRLLPLQVRATGGDPSDSLWQSNLLPRAPKSQPIHCQSKRPIPMHYLRQMDKPLLALKAEICWQQIWNDTLNTWPLPIQAWIKRHSQNTVQDTSWRHTQNKTLKILSSHKLKPDSATKLVLALSLAPMAQHDSTLLREALALHEAKKALSPEGLAALSLAWVHLGDPGRGRTLWKNWQSTKPKPGTTHTDPALKLWLEIQWSPIHTKTLELVQILSQRQYQRTWDDFAVQAWAQAALPMGPKQCPPQMLEPSCQELLKWLDFSQSSFLLN